MPGNEIIKMRGITKRYGAVVAVNDISLSVQPGEFISLLGPSGCGKTTTLRMIAGFIIPDEGQIMLSDQDVTYAPPNRRDLSLVFQSYALWPHMTVEENISYGLKLQRMTRSDIKTRVDEVLEMTALGGLGGRFPRELSGGQQQRVAVARALALRRSVMLMDEPLSNLDRKLRVDMRKELTELQQKLNITVIYVTHDQEEALSMSSRVAVMNSGRISCISTPEDLYRRPPNEFVASFIGGVNFFDGMLRNTGSEFADFESNDGLRFKVARENISSEGRVRLMTRPEWIDLRPSEEEGENIHRLKLGFIEYLGSSRKISATTETGQNVLIQTGDNSSLPCGQGDTMAFYIAPHNLVPVQ